MESNFGRQVVRLKHYVKILLQTFRAKIHGFDDFFEFPFDISNPMPTTAVNELTALINFLNSERVEYWLAEGTLLGIVRDGKLITHDTDLDFYLTKPSDMKVVNEFLIERGYLVGRFLKHRNRLFQVTFYNSDNLLVDFLLWEKDNKGDFFWIGPEIKGRRVQASSFFESSSTLFWNGLMVRTFNDYEDWLALVYGEGWTVPENKKSDWTKTIGDLESR